MKNVLKQIALFIGVAFLIFCTSSSPNEALAAKGFIGDSNLQIEALTWSYDKKSNSYEFIKKVKIKSPDFILTSNKMVALNEGEPEANSIIPTFEKIKELVATGNVIIQLNNGYITFSEKAEYFKNTKTIVLSGNPRIRSDKNEVKGCIITYFLEKESYTIESCPDAPLKGNLK